MTAPRYEARQTGLDFFSPWDVFDVADGRFLNHPGKFSRVIQMAYDLNTRGETPQPQPAVRCERCERLAAAFEHFVAGVADILPACLLADAGERLEHTIAETRQIMRGAG